MSSSSPFGRGRIWTGGGAGGPEFEVFTCLHGGGDSGKAGGAVETESDMGAATYASASEDFLRDVSIAAATAAAALSAGAGIGAGGVFEGIGSAVEVGIGAESADGGIGDFGSGEMGSEPASEAGGGRGADLEWREIGSRYVELINADDANGAALGEVADLRA